MSVTGTATLTANMQTYYDKLLLENMYPQLFFHQFGTKKNLPKNSGKTVYWTKYTKMGVGGKLTEGVVPTEKQLSSANISAALDQYGQFVKVTDLLEMAAIDPTIESASIELGKAAALELDTVTRDVLDANTNVARAGGKALSALTASDVITGATVRNAVRILKGKNAKAFSDGAFRGILHTNTSYDLQGDTATGGWVNANTYVNNVNLINGEVGKIFGVRFVESTNVSSNTSGSGGAKVYNNHIMGEGALGVVDYDGIAGNGAIIKVKRPGENSTDNPLDQFSTVGYKLTYAAAILDSDSDVLVQSGSAN